MLRLGRLEIHIALSNRDRRSGLLCCHVLLGYQEEVSAEGNRERSQGSNEKTLGTIIARATVFFFLFCFVGVVVFCIIIFIFDS